MLTAESHLHAIIPRGRGRPRQRDRGRAHDISTAAPRLLVARRSAVAAGRRLTGHRPFAASSGTPQPPAGPSDDDGSMSSSAPLLGAKQQQAAAGDESSSGESAARPPPSWSSWVGRVVDTAEARAQLRFAVPMVVTSMAYYGIPLVSVMFSGHLGDVPLAGATLGNSWATVTGYAFVVRLVLPRSLPCMRVTVNLRSILDRPARCRRRRIGVTSTHAFTRPPHADRPALRSPLAYRSTRFVSSNTT